MPAATANLDLTKQVRLSLALLESALATLREESLDNGVSLIAIAERVEEARAKLGAALSNESAGYKAAVVSGNELLGEALQSARELAGLSSRQTQSLTAVERAYAILLPLVYRSTSAYAAPVTDPRSRGIKEPVAPPALQRRRYQRVELEAEVTFDGPTNFFTGFTEDISSGGLFVSTYNIRPIGTQIDLSFTLPNGHIVNARGQVRWIHDPVEPDEDSRPGMGVMFEELLPEDRTAVDTFIKSRAPIFYDDE